MAGRDSFASGSAAASCTGQPVGEERSVHDGSRGQSRMAEELNRGGSCIVNSMRVRGKNTFIDVSLVEDQASQVSDGRRPSSAPPASESGSSASSGSMCTAQRRMRDGISSGGTSETSFHIRLPSRDPQPKGSQMYDTESASSDSWFRKTNDGDTSSSEDVSGDLHAGSSNPGHAVAAPPNMSSSGQHGQEIFSQVPLDSNGALTSIGSIGHHAGDCQPCVFLRSSAGCSNGVMCHCCHFEHNKARTSKPRPCKGKRERQKKAVARLLRQHEEQPDTIDIENIEWPAPIQNSESLKGKVLTELRQREASQRERGAAGRTHAPSTGAASSAMPSSTSSARTRMWL